MDRSETVVLAAYAGAGLLVLACAFARGRTWVFRLWCVVLGLYVAAWPAWLLRSEDLGMPFPWRVGPLAVPVLLLLVTLPGVIQRRRARGRHRSAPLPEIEDEDEDEDEPDYRYPAEVPIGQMAPPHDPWRALYDSLARQRAKWEEAAATTAPRRAPVTADEPATSGPGAASRAASRPGAGPGAASGAASRDRDDADPPQPPTGRPRQYDGRHRQATPDATGPVRALSRLWRIAQA